MFRRWKEECSVVRMLGCWTGANEDMFIKVAFNSHLICSRAPVNVSVHRGLIVTNTQVAMVEDQSARRKQTLLCHILATVPPGHRMFHENTSTRNASISSQNSALIYISNYRATFPAPAVKKSLMQQV